MVENFDEWLAIHQNFTCKPLSLNVSPLKPMINLSRFTRQNFVNDSFVTVLPIKLLCYTAQILYCHEDLQMLETAIKEVL